MPTTKINNTNVEKIQLPNQGQRVFYWDAELRGFGVKAVASGLFYVVQRRLAGRDSKLVKHVIGRHGEISAIEARKRAAAALSDLREGIDLNAAKVKEQASQVTLAQAYANFKSSRTLRPKTIEIYDGCMRRCFSDWQDKAIKEITKEMIEKKHKKLSNANGPRGKGEAQANQAMRVLRVVLNYAAVTYEDTDGRSLLPENPVKRLSQVRIWNRIPRRQDVIQPHQLKSWYQAVMKLENPVMRDYILFCVFTGLRRSEAAQLKWKQIDRKGKTITIPGDITKNHEPHQLPLSDFLVGLLSKRSKIRRINNDYVFAADKGTGHIVEPKRAIANVIKESKVKFSLHTLRRTFETTAERLDISYVSLKRLLNHKMANDVTSGYIITTTERLKQPMQRITNYLKDKMGIRLPRNVKLRVKVGKF